MKASKAMGPPMGPPTGEMKTGVRNLGKKSPLLFPSLVLGTPGFGHPSLVLGALGGGGLSPRKGHVGTQRVGKKIRLGVFV